MENNKQQQTDVTDEELRDLMKSAVDLKAALADLDKVLEPLSFNTQLKPAWQAAKKTIKDFTAKTLTMAMKERSRLS
jgi:hypothetical protein